MILVLTTSRRLSLVGRLVMVSKPQNFLYCSVWSTSALAPSYLEDSFCNIGLTVSPLLKKQKKRRSFGEFPNRSVVRALWFSLLSSHVQSLAREQKIPKPTGLEKKKLYFLA